MLFDDIGPSLIRLSSPELQLRLLLRFLSFLGLPVDPVLSAAPCQPGLLLENLSLLTQGKDESPKYKLAIRALQNILKCIHCNDIQMVFFSVILVVFLFDCFFYNNQLEGNTLTQSCLYVTL